MKIRHIFPILLLSMGNSYAQYSDVTVPKIAPVSPTVASLLKYADMPVSNYNGTSQYSIPLYEINERGLHIPISLSYSSNGLRVTEDASWVGLGWSLHAGGVIQMFYDPNNSNNGLEIIPYGFNPNFDGNDENYYENNFNGGNIVNKSQMGCQYNDLAGNITSAFLSDNNNKYMGYKHQYYIFNFGNFSGKFIKNRDHTFTCLGRENIKFEYNPPGPGMKATATDGTVYIFDVVGNTTTDIPIDGGNPCGTFSGMSSSVQYTYYLSKIISPDNAIVEFTYTQNFSRTLPILSEWKTKSNYPTDQDTKYRGIFSTNNDYILDEINTDNVRIEFARSARVDIHNGKKLDNIKIFKKGSTTPFKTIALGNSYFTGDSSFGDFTVSYSGQCGYILGTPTLDERSKRLRLDNVIIKGSDNLSTGEEFSFNYTTAALPYKTSLSQDIWGYFNGRINSTLLPNVNNLGYTDNSIPVHFVQNPLPASRIAVEDKVKWGMLSAVTQPTKGTTKIEYEINSFYHPTMNNTLGLVTKNVYNISVGKTQTTFTVPEVGYAHPFYGYNANPGKLSVHVVCSSPSLNCNNPSDNNNINCWGYNQPNSGAPATDNRLYAIIEKQNTDGTWSLFGDAYDRFNQEILNNPTGTCGIFNKDIYFVPGVYRITANFPDNMNGVLGGPWSEITVKYQDYLPATNATGAGLRIKSIKEEDNGITAKERFFTYSTGKLMTKPYFTTEYSEEPSGLAIVTTTNVSATANCPSIDLAGGCTWTSDRKFWTIFSNPVVSFTNSANGSLVGYDQVTISTSGSQANGTEVYKYKNTFDMLFRVPFMPGSITPTPRLDNGQLLEKAVFRKTSENMLLPVTKEEYVFKIRDFKILWDVFPDVRPKVSVCSGAFSVPAMVGFDRTVMHFKPVQIGFTALKQKKTTNYSLIDGFTSVPSVLIVSDYMYNGKNQLVSEKTTSSTNEIIESRTFYPIDMINNNLQVGAMNELIAENRIDLPIKKEVYKDGIQLYEQQTKFLANQATGYKVKPTEIHVMKGSGEIDVNSQTTKKIVYNRYDAYGNPAEVFQENGTITSYVWGYSGTQLIAKIENLEYASIPQTTINNMQTASDTGTEADLLLELNALRETYPNAMVTTFTHKPLIGVSTITNPNGDKITYDYDTAGRLNAIRDKENNILSNSEYHYRP